MKHWGWLAIMVLGVASAAGAGKVDRELTEKELREKPISPNDPIDFTSLRKKADAMAAKQHSSFRLHQIDTMLGFPGGGPPRIKRAYFYYFRPAASGSRPGWELLELLISTPVQLVYGRWSPGHISGSKGLFDDPRPDPAPANIVSPEEAIGRLQRGPMSSPVSGGLPSNLPKDRSRWELSVQLIRIGAKYLVATPGWRPPDAHMIPSLEIATSRDFSPPFFSEEPFFMKTAPSGKWVWWTVIQHVARGRRFEHLYMDAVTGTPTSHCAEQPGGLYTPLVPVPCAPPR